MFDIFGIEANRRLREEAWAIEREWLREQRRNPIAAPAFVTFKSTRTTTTRTVPVRPTKRPKGDAMRSNDV